MRCANTPVLLRRENILSASQYCLRRTDVRQHILRAREVLSVDMSPAMMVHIETRETLWFQVQETAFMEQLQLAEIDAELEAYEPLVSQCGEITIRLELDRSWAREVGQEFAKQTLESLYLKVTANRTIAVELLPETPTINPLPLVHYARFRIPPDLWVRFLSCQTDVALGFKCVDQTGEGNLSQQARSLIALDWQGQSS